MSLACCMQCRVLLHHDMSNVKFTVNGRPFQVKNNNRYGCIAQQPLPPQRTQQYQQKKSTIFAQIYYPSNLVFFRTNPRNQSLVLFHFPKFGYKICEQAQPRPNQVMNDEGTTRKNGRVCPQCNQTRLLKFLIHNVPLASVRVFIIFMVWHRLKLDLMRAAFMHLGNIYDKPDLYNFRDFKIDQR